MSGMTVVNKIAAESVSGGDETIAATIATALGLIHVLQVYTSVCTSNISLELTLSLTMVSMLVHGPFFYSDPSFCSY